MVSLCFCACALHLVKMKLFIKKTPFCFLAMLYILELDSEALRPHYNG